jgi:1,4-alpha-glucan branching enzyme
MNIAIRPTLSPWGSCQFDLGKDPVRSFLMSAMNYFLCYFHFDGIRVDAVSNIVYWDGNKANGENTGATEFIKRLNGKIHYRASRSDDDRRGFDRFPRGDQTPNTGAWASITSGISAG